MDKYKIENYYDHYVIKEDKKIVGHFDNEKEANEALSEIYKKENITIIEKSKHNNNNNNYTVFHLHSDLSNGITNIDSVTKFDEYIKYAASLGMKSMAFSEHGCILEWVKKKTTMEKYNIKYIHAEEFYITEDIQDGSLIRDNYHCVLIAKNYNGVVELNQLSSKSFLRDGHFYYNPRITFEELSNTSDNIIVTSACLGGALSKGNDEMKKKFLKFMIENKDRCYLEIQHHNVESQIKYNKILYAISKKFNIPLISGTDTHALNDRHLLGRSIMQKSKGVIFADESSWDLTFKTYEELIQAYEKQNALPREVYLQAIENTNLMAEQIEEFKLDYTKKYPKLYDDSLKVFKQKIVDGIKARGIDKYPNYDEYKKRIAYEIDTYIHNGAVDFMLLEENYKTALRSQGVDYGYSRGSVSGSIVAYLLNITDVDSIKYELNFERFMNKERVSLADVDSDWFSEDRWRVRDYLFKKDGLYCCNIITFNTVKMRGAIKDVGRALDMTPQETQEISNMVQEDENKKEFVEDNIREKYKELFEYVDIVVGTITSLGRHAAGLVVSPHDVDSAFGTLYISSDDKPISQINMKEIDSLNYVKLDVLGLDCVGLISKTCRYIGIPFLTPDNMNFNDEDVWKDIAKDTTLIFQYESDFAGDYLKSILQPDIIKKIKEKNEKFSYLDIMSMANGAIRPAGASYRNELSQGIYRDNGNKELNDFLAPTLGYLVYQEQIIGFLHKFCGFTMGEADIVRRHFSKKTGTENDIPIIKDGGHMINDKGEKTEHYIRGFIQTMKEDYGVEKEESEKIIVNFLQVIIDASSYLFSLNHSEPYSMLGFAVAYLRHYYPLETTTQALNIYMSDDDKSSLIKAYAKQKGFEIEGVRFGKSKSEYECDLQEKKIYQGISSIKFCNSQIAEELLMLSKENKYASFIQLLDDISSKTSVNSKQLNILTSLNFFSDFGNNKYLLDIINIYNGIKANNKTVLPSIRTCSTIKKEKIDDYSEYGITEFLVKKYSNKETAKQYSDIDNIGLLNELMKSFSNDQLPVMDQIKAEREYLGYCMYVNPKMNSNYYIVVNFDNEKATTRPKLVLRNLSSGEEIKTRIKYSKTFKENSFGDLSIIEVKEFTESFKKKKVGDKWVDSDETEKILEDYQVLKK